MKKFFIFSMLCLLAVAGFAPAAQAQSDCEITTLPFTEGFESGSIPPCFTRNTQNSSMPDVLDGTMNPYVVVYDGNCCLRSYNYMYDESSPMVPMLIFPELDTQFDINTMVLSFWGLINSSVGTIVVGVMTDNTDISTFTPVQTILPGDPSDFTNYSVYFTNYTGTGRYIAMKFPATAYSLVKVDNIVLDQAAMCSPVVNLALEDMVGTDATITWQPNALGTASVYNITLKDLDAGTDDFYSTTDTFYTFLGLNYTTHYRAFVEVLCTDNTVSPADSVDFTTLAASAPFPYFEDFEGDSVTALAIYNFTSSGPDQWVYGTAASENAGGHCLYISADSGATNIYNGSSSANAYAYFNITFPNDDVEYHFSFDYRVEGEANTYANMAYDSMLVFMADADAVIPASGIPYGAVPLMTANGISTWSHYDMILPNVAGATKQIVFHWHNNGYNLYGSHLGAAVDNIHIMGNDCAQPSNLAAMNLTEESATLSWQENGTATDWNVYYKPAGSADPYTEISVSSDTFTVLTGLASNTDYLFYVVADCGSDLSAATNPLGFRTTCGVVTQLPYTETFESGLYATAQQDFISCWSRSTSDPSHYVYVNNSSWDAYNGIHYLDFHYTPNCYVIAIMPQLADTINVSDLMLTFHAAHTYSGYYGSLGTLEVGVMTNPDYDSTFAVLDTIDLTAAESYTYVEQIISLLNYTGNGKHIAFRVSNCESTSYYIDDLVLDRRPSCMNPNNLMVVSGTNDSVTLSWTEMGEATMWNIQYGAPGFTPGNDNTSLFVNTTTYTIGDLSNFTSYEFYVQADCGGEQSEWVGPVQYTTGLTAMGTLGMDSLVTCEALICDNGGENGDYASFCSSMMVVYPATAGSGLTITGSCDLVVDYGESNLYFYEGFGTSGPLLAHYNGQSNNISVASSGPITIHFTSGYYTSPGFLLHVMCASCTPPSNLHVTNVTPNSATVAWDGNADQYEVVVTDSVPTIYTSSTNSLNLTGLVSSTTYQVMVRALCGTDSSLFSPVVTFNTACDPLTITETTPWTEDFEGYQGNGNQPFVCWDRPVVDGSYGAPFVYCGYSASCHSGDNSAEFKGSDAMLALPAFTNDIHTLRLSFWATSTLVTSGTLDVGVITDLNDPNSFEYVGVCGQPGPRGDAGTTGNGLLMGPFDFSGVTATSGRIALRYSNNVSSASWNLDDFTVEIIPDTVVPQQPTVVTYAASDITQTSGTLNGAITDAGNQTIILKGFEWKLANDNDYTPVVTLTGNTLTYTLAGLAPNTCIVYRAYATTVAGTVYGDTMSFCTLGTTPTPCVDPTSLAVDNITQTSAVATWAAGGSETAWNVRYKAVSATSWTEASVTTTAFTMTNLTPNTPYQVCVQASCSVSETSSWVCDEFTTLPEDVEPCEAPTNLQQAVALKEAGSIAVYWTDNAGVSEWNLQYRPLNGEWITVVVTGQAAYTINGLENGEDYEVRVQAVCGDGVVSEWSSILTATATNSGIDNYLLNSVTLYPNPAMEVVNVQCAMNNVQLGGELHLLDVYGKLLQIVPITSETTQINVSCLADGMYFVRVTTEAGAVTKSFVKR